MRTMWVCSWTLAILGLTVLIVGVLYMGLTSRTRTGWLWGVGAAVALVCLGPALNDWFYARVVRGERAVARREQAPHPPE